MNTNTNQIIITRFAPSPTGNLHIGGARTALFNWLFAKNQKGKFLLRIEDTDTQRSKNEFYEQIISTLKWLEINWNEEPYGQEVKEGHPAEERVAWFHHRIENRHG